MSIQREYTRLICKRSIVSGTEPSVPSTSEIDGGWVATDIYEGELFINTADDRIWFRSQNGLVEIGANSFVTGSTTDATITVLDSFTTGNDYIYYVEAIVLGLEDDASNGISVKMEGTYRNDAGTLSIVGSLTKTTKSDFATALADIKINGTDLDLQVQGEAATNIEWKFTYKITRYNV